MRSGKELASTPYAWSSPLLFGTVRIGQLDNCGQALAFRTASKPLPVAWVYLGEHRLHPMASDLGQVGVIDRSRSPQMRDVAVAALVGGCLGRRLPGLGARGRGRSCAPARSPGDPVRQLVEGQLQRRGELQGGVEPGQPRPLLQVADLGAVQGAERSQFFLGEPGSAAGDVEVATEPPGGGSVDSAAVHQRSVSSWKRTAALVGATIAPARLSRPPAARALTARLWRSRGANGLASCPTHGRCEHD